MACRQGRSLAAARIADNRAANGAWVSLSRFVLRRAREKAEAVRRYRKLLRKRMEREGY